MITEQPLSPVALAAPPAIKKSRMAYIDALRGFACLWVIMRHSFGVFNMHGHGLTQLPFRILLVIGRMGWLGVSLFLVLSGFCLYHQQVVKAHPSDIKLDLKKFAVSRARRILPPYYAALFIFAAIELIPSVNHTLHLGGTVWSFIAHLTMVYNLSPATLGSYNGSFWSLALECQLYLIMPLLVWLAARYGLKMILVLTFLVSLAWQVYVYAFLHIPLSLDWDTLHAAYYHALPGRCFEFAIGMCAAYWATHPQPHFRKNAIIAAAVLLLPASLYVLKFSMFGPLCDQMWGIIFASFVIILATGNRSLFDTHPLLTKLVWLGTISYSVYLIHQPICSIITPALFHIKGDYAVTAFAIVRAIAVIAVGFVFYQLIERHFAKPKPSLTFSRAETSS